MKRISGLAILIILISGCGPHPCEQSDSLARSEDFKPMLAWIDANIFANPELVTDGGAHMGTRTIRKEYLKRSGIVPDNFRNILQYRSRDGERINYVFLSKLKMEGILVSHPEMTADEFIKFRKLEPYTTKISERVAIICEPSF